MQNYKNSFTTGRSFELNSYLTGVAAAKLWRYLLNISLQNKYQTADTDRQNWGRSNKFWQNGTSVRQVSDLILKTEICMWYMLRTIQVYFYENGYLLEWWHIWVIHGHFKLLAIWLFNSLCKLTVANISVSVTDPLWGESTGDWWLLTLCEENLPVTPGFHSQMASNMESFSMLWRYHVT